MCCVLSLCSCDVWRYRHGRLVDSLPPPLRSFTLFRFSCFMADSNGGSLRWSAMLAIAESPESSELERDQAKGENVVRSRPAWRRQWQREEDGTN